MITVYRFENIHDGGGPFCLPDGRMRHRPDSRFEDVGISGCKSVDLLFEYFEKSAPAILSNSDYVIVHYEIDESQVIMETKREIVFKL